VRTAIHLLLLVGLTACTLETDIRILEPPRGSMLPAGKTVSLLIESDGDGVQVNGVDVPGDGQFRVNTAPADGLGFIWAQRKDSGFVATRSWHQGHYLPPYDWHPATVHVDVGAAALMGSAVSISSLVNELLAGTELVGNVKPNPLTMSVKIGLSTVSAQVTVESLKVSTVSSTLKATPGKLAFSLTLGNTTVRYRTAASIFTTSGKAVYPKMIISGALKPAPGQSTVEGITFYADDPQITDSILPSVAIQALAVLFKNKLNAAIRDAAVATARSLVDKLLLELRPTVGVAFPKPITQASTLERATVTTAAHAALALSFKTLIQAKTPAAAHKSHAVLRRTIKGATPSVSSPVRARFGSPMVNQYLFAAWDAGNLSNIRFTRAELEQLGMEKLSFPYNQLDHVVIKVLLPPLLRWQAGKPVLDVGGVEMFAGVNLAEDPRAWTASTVPVALVAVGPDLRMLPDPHRKIQIHPLGFDKFNTAADIDAVMRILKTAVPGVVKKVFSILPQIVLPKVHLTRLDGTKGPKLGPVIRSVGTGADHWVLGLEIRKE